MVLEILLSIGALAGGLVLMIAPRGEIMRLPLSALAGSPFDTYLVPGLILFGVLGLGPLVAALLAWLRHPLAPTAAFVVGVGLLIWLAVEVAIIGYSDEPPLQAVYGILGVAIVLVACRWLLDVGLPRLDGVPHAGPTITAPAPSATEHLDARPTLPTLERVGSWIERVSSGFGTIRVIAPRGAPGSAPNPSPCHSPIQPGHTARRWSRERSRSHAPTPGQDLRRS